MVLCDIESRWGRRVALEIASIGELDSGWTYRSDIFDIGNCIKFIAYANAPIMFQVEWPVPQPLQAILDVCMSQAPTERASRLELQEMLQNITRLQLSVPHGV